MVKIIYSANHLSSGEKLRIRKILRFRDISIEDAYFIVNKFFGAMTPHKEVSLRETIKAYTEDEILEYLDESKSFFLQVLRFEAWNSIASLVDKDGNPKSELKENMLVYDEQHYPALYKNGRVHRLEYLYKYWNDFMYIGEAYD